MNTTCPYCNKDLGKEIKRKISCPFCKKVIYVRKGSVVTEREKEIVDWQAYMEFLVPDITLVRIEVEKELTEKFKKQPDSGDVVWGMFNYIVTRLREPRDLEILYENMATFLESEGKHAESNKLKQQAFKMKMLDFKKSNFYKFIKLKNSNDAFVCEECNKFNDKKISIEEAYKNPPLPILTCSNKQCRCTIDFVSMYDEQDGTSKDRDYTITINLKKEDKKKGLLSKIIGKLF